LFSRFVAFGSDEARWAVTLWTGHAHAVEAFESTPRLALLSPEKGSCKTRTLEVLGLVVPEPMHAVNMSAAALYRVIGEKHPTLLLDEADTYLGASVAKQHEDLRGLINAGCALAGLGDLPDTILDRSVVIAMKRRASHEVPTHSESETPNQAPMLHLRLFLTSGTFSLSGVMALRPLYPHRGATRATSATRLG
jgi:hypothetical protein